MRSLLFGISIALCFLASTHAGIGGYSPYGDIHWKPPVASAAALPALGNSPGDVRLELTSFGLYYWTGSSWDEFSGGGGGGGVTAVTGTSPIASSGGSAPNITCQTASGTQPGCLSSSDWSTFNSKQSSLTIGNLIDAGIDGITVTGGSSSVIGSGTSISQHVADTTHSGYLASADWNTFNGKQSALTFIDSLSNSAGSISLSGDSASPGNSQYYGTNGSGTKGFYTLPSGFVNPMTTLGDIMYGGASGTATRLAGNSTASRYFLMSQGTGSVAQAPSYSLLQSGDIPNNAANTSGTAGALSQSLTQYAPLVGNGTGLTAIGGTGTSGQPLLSGGNSANPAYGNLGVAAGGTGATSLTSGAPLFGAGTSAITTGTLSGNTTKLGSVTGSLTAGNTVTSDASGNLKDSGYPAGSPLPSPSPSASGAVLVWNGSSWVSTNSISVSVSTPWQAYTPTFTGFGTVSTSNLEYRQDGANYEIQGYFIAGTTTNVTAYFTLPNNAIVGGTEPATTIIQSGYWTTGNLTTAANFRLMGTVGSSLGLGFTVTSSSSAGNSLLSGTAIGASGNVFFVHASVPIFGLSGTTAQSVATSPANWSGTSTLSGSSTSTGSGGNDPGSVSGSVTTIGTPQNISCSATASTVGVTCTGSGIQSGSNFEISYAGYTVNNTAGATNYVEFTDGSNNVIANYQGITISTAGGASSFSGTVGYTSSSTSLSFKIREYITSGTGIFYLTSFSIKSSSTPVNAVTLTGGLSSNYTGGNVRGEITQITPASGSSCTVSATGTGLAGSTTPNATGDCTITFASAYSVAPLCFPAPAVADGSNTDAYHARVHDVSTTSVHIMTQYTVTGSSTITPNPNPVNVLCFGPR